MKIIGIHIKDGYKVIHNINKDWGNVYHFCRVEGEEGEMIGIDPQDFNWTVEEEYILIKFQKMCEESLSPEQFEMFKTIEKQLLIVRKNLK